ncbi:MAG: packaged DNA stabilization protein gp10 [Candidatus Berkelbacteria bacterium]|nr:packaged DNA stabilization protein gp10 [Candidatus Berkelbacteria bacterium]
MPVIPLFGTNLQGKSSTSTSQRHLNLYVENVIDGEKSRLIFYGTPGLILRAGASLGDTPIRGWIAVGSLYYLVHRGTFYEVNNSGTKTSRGTLDTTSGRVDMAYNGTVILITTGTTGYTYTISTLTLASIAAAAFPDAAKTCTWLDGQFLVDDGADDEYFISADGTTWNALDFATAESAPDGLVRVFADNGEVVLFGTDTTEYLSNTGASDFPFQTIKGATQEFGLAARWSLTKFNSGLAGLMKNKNGQVQVMFIQGYVPKPISSQELDSIINGYSSVSDATAYAYMLGGHPMYQINFPTPLKSWLYDASTGMWSSLEYGLSGERHRGELQLDFLNKTLIADYSTGDIYQMDADTRTDNGVAIAREITGRHLFNSNDPVIVDELFVDFETGVGLITGQGSDPQAMLSVSKDNGHTFGNESWKSIGAIGKYLDRVVWRRLGLGLDWVFKIRISDPIKICITYAAIKTR